MNGISFTIHFDYFFKHLRKQDGDIQHGALFRFSRCSRLFLKDSTSDFWNEVDAPNPKAVFQFDISTEGAAWTGQLVICWMVFLVQRSVRWLQSLTLHHLHYGSLGTQTPLGIWTHTGLKRTQESTVQGKGLWHHY